MGNVHMIPCMISYVCTTISYVNLRYRMSTYDIVGYQESRGSDGLPRAPTATASRPGPRRVAADAARRHPTRRASPAATPAYQRSSASLTRWHSDYAHPRAGEGGGGGRRRPRRGGELRVASSAACRAAASARRRVCEMRLLPCRPRGDIPGAVPGPGGGHGTGFVSLAATASRCH